MINLEGRIERLILEEFKDELGTYDGRTDSLAHEIMNLIRSLPREDLDAELKGEWSPWNRTGEKADAK